MRKKEEIGWERTSLVQRQKEGQRQRDEGKRDGEMVRGGSRKGERDSVRERGRERNQ